jgi:hypothetical protein
VASSTGENSRSTEFWLIFIKNDKVCFRDFKDVGRLQATTDGRRAKGLGLRVCDVDELKILNLS